MQKELVVELLPSAVHRETGSLLLVNALCLIQQALQQGLAVPGYSLLSSPWLIFSSRS